MEYYGLRKAGDDIDLIVITQDYETLSQQYHEYKKDTYGDLGVIVHGFEIWKTIRWFDYEFYSQQAIEKDEFKIISLEKLLFMKSLAMEIPKYKEDLQLIVNKINGLSLEKRKKIFTPG